MKVNKFFLFILCFFAFNCVAMDNLSKFPFNPARHKLLEPSVLLVNSETLFLKVLDRETGRLIILNRQIFMPERVSGFRNDREQPKKEKVAANQVVGFHTMRETKDEAHQE